MMVDDFEESGLFEGYVLEDVEEGEKMGVGWESGVKVLSTILVSKTTSEFGGGDVSGCEWRDVERRGSKRHLRV